VVAFFALVAVGDFLPLFFTLCDHALDRCVEVALSCPFLHPLAKQPRRDDL
jgi:hypothetical protein